jgi:dTDP-4-amino-4,6-dideoxygalactose transaminase
MTDFQAALGLSQMQRLDEYVSKRHALAARYDERLKDIPVTTPWQHTDSYSGLHLYVIRLQLDVMKASHRDVFESLRTTGIGVNLHYIPVYRQPYYACLGFKPSDFPQAENYYAEAISLPMYPGLTETDQAQVIAAFKEVPRT